MARKRRQPFIGLPIHERCEVVDKAERELRSAISEWSEKYLSELTTAEYLKVVTECLSECLSGDVLLTLKYLIRQERHGNTDDPGDLA